MLLYRKLIRLFVSDVIRIALPVVLFVFCMPDQAHAWVYPEHRRISLAAIQKLSFTHRSALDRLWSQLQQQHSTRLATLVIDTSKAGKGRLLDYAAWPAIAGDHSCSPSDMLNTILRSQWIFNVNDIGVKLGERLATAQNSSQRSNYLRSSDMQLLKKDAQYATRAGVNSVHFLLPREQSGINIDQYLQSCIQKGAALNAMGVYAYFHSSAMLKMMAYTQEPENAPDKLSLLIAAMADEAFALHFLQDAFAAGHIAGSWGGAALQKGTHDHYNEEGLEVQTWAGKRKVVKGDAWMTDQDIELASAAVSQSLTQLLSVAGGTITLETAFVQLERKPADFNVCSNLVMPDMKYDTAAIREILLLTPVSGLYSGAGALPRFRAEIGPFIGVSTSLNASSISGGFGNDQTEAGGLGGLDANLRLGLGLEGVINQSGDGLMFLDLGWRQESASTNTIFYSGGAVAANAFASAIPARSAYNIRIRVPFFLIPGDLIFAAPIVGLLAPSAYKKMAIAAVNGGLIPWQSAIRTKVGRFQMVLGREVGLSLYGLRGPRDFVILPDKNDQAVLVEYRSTKIEMPILEYRAYRSFSSNQASSIMIQLYTGVDMPHGAKVIAPTNVPLPALKPVWFAGLRFLFNWRHYL